MYMNMYVLFICIHMYTSLSICICIHIYIYIHRYTYILYKSMYIYICIHIEYHVYYPRYIYIYIHIYIYIYHGWELTVLGWERYWNQWLLAPDCDIWALMDSEVRILISDSRVPHSGVRLQNLSLTLKGMIPSCLCNIQLQVLSKVS